MKILISSCLLGLPCRYDGKSKPNENVLALAREHTLIPFCPEIYGGLPTPRTPAEIANGKVLTQDGRDVTKEYEKGAQGALFVCQTCGCDCAILQDKSPSCGVGTIHNGLFDGGLIAGDGITARLLSENGIRVLPASDVKM